MSGVWKRGHGKVTCVTARRKGRQQTNQTYSYRYRATSRLYRAAVCGPPSL